MGASRGRDSLFATTQWSLVLAASDTENPDAREALTALCQTYWYPVYAQIRRQERNPEKARDLTQGFFVELLAKRSFKVADPDRGRFRSFLRGTLRHYLSHERQRDRAEKRGGGKTPIPLDLDTAESYYRLEPSDERTPETLFERQWARTLLNRVFERLREELDASGQGDRFRVLQPFLTGRAPAVKCRQAATELGVSEDAVRVAVHRLRKRYGQLLRDEVSRTVRDKKEVDAEIRYLFSVMDG